MGKKVLFLLISIFLTWQSYKLVDFLSQHLQMGFLFTVLVGWILNMFVTGVFAFLVFGFSIEAALPDKYYKIHNSGRLKKTCRTLQIELFRIFLLHTFWRSKKRNEKLFDGTVKGLENLELQSKKSEFGHLFPFIILTGICIYFIILGLYLLVFSIMAFNILGNLYPILLQRHHRMRIKKLRKRFQD